MRRYVSLTAVICFLLIPALSSAQEATVSYVKAEILHIVRQEGAEENPVQEVQARILTGGERGQTVHFPNTIINNREDLRLIEGETVILQRLEWPDGTTGFYLQEKHRLPAVAIVLVLFVCMGILAGGWRGLTAVLGLCFSIAFIAFVLFPLILKGLSPLLVCCAGSVLIACMTLYVAHGLNKRTTLALFATAAVLVLAAIFSIVTVYVTKLFGMGSEAGVFLQWNPSQFIDMRGLLMGGIIIGALGVLDDVTTAQVTAVFEVSKANPSFDFSQLYRAGIAVGREHVASMINTLALAYIGASLPLFLLLYLNEDVPLWVVLNSAFLAEEVMRTVVGSTALFLAVPVSTWLAARTFAGARRHLMPV